MDRYLKGQLKNWAGQQQPPDSVRARLILLAAISPDEQPSPPTYYQENKHFQNKQLPDEPGQGQARYLDLLYMCQMPALRMV